MKRKLATGAGLAFLALLVTNCSTVNVPVRVMRPAEINMTNYKQIVISPIGGNMGTSFSDSVKYQLVESNKFQVVDRARLSQVLGELNLSQSDLADPNNATKLGKLLTASAMIAGKTDGSYNEEVTSEKATCGNKKEGYYSCTNYYRNGVFKTSGSMDVIDISTGQIIKSKLISNTCSASTSATNKTPEKIDRDQLVSTCLSKDVTTFVRSISPWAEIVQVPFKKDSKIPELERGIAQATLGDLQDAIVIFANSAKGAEMNPKLKASNIAACYWNLGLAYEYSWEFQKAIENFKKAYTLEQDKKYLGEIQNVMRLMREQQKLKEQGI